MKRSIKFQNSLDISFARELKRQVNELVKNSSKNSVISYQLRSLFFIITYFFIWYHLAFVQYSVLVDLALVVLFGINSVLIGFTVGHDAGHGSFAKNKQVNKGVFYLVYNSIGLSSFIWHHCHNQLHHPFVNIPGHDIDVQENPVMRLGRHNKHKDFHRYQHIYGPLLYGLFFLFKFLYNDFRCFFGLRNKFVGPKKIKYRYLVEMICLKIAYIGYMIVLPIMFSGYSTSAVITTYLIFIGSISVFFAFTLGGSHISAEAEFGHTNEDNEIEQSYFRHQMSACIDFNSESKMMGYFFGGLNTHVAHHLFPKMSPVYYPGISKIIKNLSKKYQMPYKETTVLKLWKNHYQHIKSMGQNA
jgi:linoleoyl-CoA desaturase